MRDMLKKTGLGIALGATALATTAAPADAQRWHGHGGYHHYYRGGGAGPAIVAGVAGLAIGAAIASNTAGRDRYYRDYGYQPGYDSYYYRDHGYYPPDGYYAWYYRHHGYRGCWVERRVDPYWHRTYPVRVCR